MIYFSWQIIPSNPPAPRFSAADPGVEKLVLASEHAEEQARKFLKIKQEALRRKQQEEIRQARQEEAARTRAKASCYVLGDFLIKNDAKVALKGIKALDYQASLKTYYPEKSKLLVYLPSFPTLADARKVVRELKAKGQEDFQILAIKGKRNGISLGVFRQPTMAEERVAEIASLGYSPIMMSVTGKKIKYRINFNKKNSISLTDDEKRFLAKSFKNVAIKPLKCR